MTLCNMTLLDGQRCCRCATIDITYTCPEDGMTDGSPFCDEHARQMRLHATCQEHGRQLRVEAQARP